MSAAGDLRKTVIWIVEQIEEGRGDTPVCADCGHGLQHHLADRAFRSCTYPKALGAPRALCSCLDYMPGSADDVEA